MEESGSGYASGCQVCGANLVYREEVVTCKCEHCGNAFEAREACENGHYVCNTCHSGDAYAVIKEFCLGTDLADPLKMSVALMRHPAMHMHGPEHHFMVPAVLIAAYCRAAGRMDDLPSFLAEAMKRAVTVTGGSCGFFGACGAAVGTGIFVSIVTGTTPLSKAEWGLTVGMQARTSLAIAEGGGPRCCKRVVYTAIREATAYSAEKLGVLIPSGEKVYCGFYRMNKDCRKNECKFYPVRAV